MPTRKWRNRYLCGIRLVTFWIFLRKVFGIIIIIIVIIIKNSTTLEQLYRRGVSAMLWHEAWPDRRHNPQWKKARLLKFVLHRANIHESIPTKWSTKGNKNKGGIYICIADAIVSLVVNFKGLAPFCQVKCGIPIGWNDSIRYDIRWTGIFHFVRVKISNGKRCLFWGKIVAEV